MEAVIAFESLQRVSGKVRSTAVARWLKREGIAFLRDARGRPFTTLDEMTRAVQGVKSLGQSKVRLDAPPKVSPLKKRPLLFRAADR